MWIGSETEIDDDVIGKDGIGICRGSSNLCRQVGGYGMEVRAGSVAEKGLLPRYIDGRLASLFATQSHHLNKDQNC